MGELRLQCGDYGFECDFAVDGRRCVPTLERLREHFEAEHGIEYSREFVIQMAVNRGHARGSIPDE